MRLFKRIGDIVSVNLNEMVDHFENPEKMLRQATREMERAVTAALDAAVKAVAHEKILAKQLAENKRYAECYRDRAALAVEADDDALARRALTRKTQHDKLVAALEDQQTAANETSRKLRCQIDGMRAKLAEAKRKLATLTARKQTAEARRQLLEVTASSDPLAAFSKFDQLYDRVEFAEAEAEAYCELTGGDDSGEFDDFDVSDIEQELATLKENVGK